MATLYDHASLDGRLSEVEQQLRLARQETVGSKRLRKEQTEAFNSLSLKYEELREQLTKQGASPVLAGQISSLELAVANLGPRVEILERGQAELSELVDTANRATNSQLAELAVNDHMHSEAIQSMSARLDGASASAATANARLDARDDVPWWTVVVGIIIGIIAGVTWAAHDFTVVAASQSTAIIFPSWADKPWVAFAVGILVAIIVFGLMLVIAAAGSRRTSSSSSSASAGATNTPVPAPAQQPVPVQNAQASARVSA